MATHMQPGQPSIPTSPAPTLSQAAMRAAFGRREEWLDIPNVKGFVRVFDMRDEDEIHLSAEVTDEIIKTLTTKKLKE